MAKSLEEHLYRSAKSKADYTDLNTLKKRLQAIAHGLEIHRSSSPGNSVTSEQSTGLAQLGVSLRNNNDETNSQNSNFSVTAAVRSTMGTPVVSGQGNVQGNSDVLNMIMQGSQQQGNTLLSNPGNAIHLQGGAATARQQGDNWSMNQEVRSGNLLIPHATAFQEQDQGNIFPMSAQNSGNLMSDQRNPSQMTSKMQNNSQDTNLFSSASSLQPNVTDFDGTSDSNLMIQEQSAVAGWGLLMPSNETSETNDSSILAKFQDPTASQKKKVIVQQQQRLLLLRHASKCTIGLQCSTKFCDQMVTLWKHMKTCRNKNCKTSHCLSSRCVLNHYRICKSNGRTSTCEVCGPVMLRIKQQERDDGTADDPLTREQDNSGQIPLVDSAPLVATSLQGRPDFADPSDQSQLCQVQAQQSKLQAQLDTLKVLRRQQEQLLEQQKNLEMQAQNISDPNSSQARQLQDQHILLQQLQNRCQQQQLLVQEELQMKSIDDVDNPSTQMVGDDVQSQDEDKPIPIETQLVQRPNRRGSGIGKRFCKSLGLPAARKASESEESLSKKKRGSITKTERTAKKPRPVPKPKAISDGNDDALQPFENDGTSVLGCLTRAEIQRHLESLNKRIILSSRTVTHKCRPIVQEIIEDQFGWVFREAVDPVALGLPDYYDVIKNPMHLDLIRKKLENAIYSDMESFARDTRLVFENAILYNGESSEVGELAQIMLSRFDKLYNTVMHGTRKLGGCNLSFADLWSNTACCFIRTLDIESSHTYLESQGELCSLCGVQKRRFEPTVLYCQGKCGMQRIKRNAAYFTDRTKQNHWCDVCFAQLDPNQGILLDDGTKVFKKELQELKNDALPEEGWVNCDDCRSWVHQVCSMFCTTCHHVLVILVLTYPPRI